MGGCFSKEQHVELMDKEQKIKKKINNSFNEEPMSGISQENTKNLFSKISSKDREQLYEKVKKSFQDTSIKDQTDAILVQIDLFNESLKLWRKLQ